MRRIITVLMVSIFTLGLSAAVVSAHNGPPGPVIPPDANHADHPARPCNGDNSGPYRSEPCPVPPVVCPPGTAPQDNGMMDMMDKDHQHGHKPKVIVVVCVPVVQPPVVQPPAVTPPATPVAAPPAPAATPAPPVPVVQGRRAGGTQPSPSRARVAEGASCARRSMSLTVRGAAVVRRVSVSVNGHRVAVRTPNSRTVTVNVRRRGSGVQRIVIRVTIGGRVQTIRRTVRGSCVAAQAPAPQFTG